MGFRFLFFFQSPIPYPHAAWTRISFFAQYFKSKGHDVSMAGAFSLSSLDKAGLSKWNDIKILNITPIVRMSNMFSLAFNILSSLITSVIPIILERPQIIIISVPPGETAVSCFIAAKLLRINKIVFDYRDEWEDAIISVVHSKIYKRAYQMIKHLMTKCYLSSDMVVTVTEAMSQSLSLRGVKNVKVVTNGADTNVFKPYPKSSSRKKIGLKEDDFVLVYNGGIHTYYRLDVVLRALRKVIIVGNKMKLLIVGYGSNVKDVMILSRELGLEDNVYYLGSKEDKGELAEILSACNVGIIPYDSNPLWKTTIPAKALEYLACGLPVLVTYYEDSVIGKLISENRIGLRSDPEDIDSLATNIERIYNDTAFVADCAERASSLVEHYFDRNRTADVLLNSILLSAFYGNGNARQ